MYLEISNFRCWKNKKIELPPTGLVLLSGVSGSGKTSILDAIYFALFGIGKKVVKRGEKKCTVHLIYQGLDITRTKGPDRLLLLENKNEYEDDVAQEIINKKFGKNFTVTSYITQKMVNSFLNLGPSDKMLFLEQLALDEDNISVVKKKVKEKIREKKDTLLQKVAQLEVLSKELGNMTKPEEVSFPLGGKYSEVKVKNESIYWKRTLKEIQEKNKLKKEAEKEQSEEKLKITLQNKYQKMFEELKEKLTILKEEEKEINFDEEELNSMQETLLFLKNKREFSSLNEYYNKEKKNFDDLFNQELKKREEEIEELNREREKIKEVTEDEIKEAEKKVKLYEKKERLKEELKFLRQKGDEILDFEKEITTLSESLTQVEKKKKDLEQRIDIKKCPCCNVSLKIIEDELIQADKEPITGEETKQITELKKEITNTNKKLESVKKEKILYDQEEKKREKIKKELEEIGDIEIEDDVDNLKRNKVERARLSKDILDLKNKKDPTLKKMQIQLETKKKELENIKKNLEEDIETDYTEDELIEEISVQKVNKQKKESIVKQRKEAEKKLEETKRELDKIKLTNKDFDSEIEELSSKLESLEIKEKQHKEKNEEIKKYLEYKTKLEDYLKWETKVEECKEEEKKASKLLALTETFMRKITEAESMAISETVYNINHYMNFYLEKFFPEEAITVEICPYKETKKDIKPVINVEVGYQGYSTDVTTLSGGQYDRVTLSVLLSLNTIFGSNLLMLDESIASLDSELTNEILETLRDCLKDKLIIVVAHQIGVGVFDNVIKVDEE